VLAADPVELVSLLYQACMQAVREARYHLAEGRIAERSKQINQACAIVIELTTSLDHERGGEISQRLALLYDYMQRRLLEANMKQADAPLADVLGLLTTLSEAWSGVKSAETKPTAETPKAQPVAESWSQSAPVAEDWSQSAPAAESPWSQPASANPWSQPVPESPWSAPAAASAWAPPESETAWPPPPPVMDGPWSESGTESAGSQPAAATAWSQPAVEVDDYRLRAFSF
jgi:flagellar protein FliS